MISSAGTLGRFPRRGELEKVEKATLRLMCGRAGLRLQGPLTTSGAGGVEPLPSTARNLRRRPALQGGAGPSKGGSVSQSWQTFKVKGDDLLRRVKEIIHEGNVRRVVIKQGSRTVVEFPVTVGVVGAVAAPALAALGAVAALLSECTIQVEREAQAAPKAAPRRPAGRSRVKKA